MSLDEALLLGEASNRPCGLPSPANQKFFLKLANYSVGNGNCGFQSLFEVGIKQFSLKNFSDCYDYLDPSKPMCTPASSPPRGPEKDDTAFTKACKKTAEGKVEHFKSREWMNQEDLQFFASLFNMTVVLLSYQDSKNLDNRWLVPYMPDSCAPQEEGAGEASSEALLMFAPEAKAHIIIPEFKEPLSSAVEKARTAVGLPLLLGSTVNLLFSAQHFNLLLEVDPEEVAELTVLSYPTALIEEANISKQSFEDQSCKVCGFPPFGDDNFLGKGARGPHAACAAAALQAQRHAETQGSRKRPSRWDVCTATILPTDADNANAITAPADATLIFPCVNATAPAPERAVAATEDGSINPVARPAAAAVALDAACSEAGAVAAFTSAAVGAAVEYSLDSQPPTSLPTSTTTDQGLALETEFGVCYRRKRC
eukprot:g1128.t1